MDVVRPKETIENIKKQCDKFGFEFHETVDGIFIRTPSIAGWMILFNEYGDIRLFHENYRKMRRNNKTLMAHYHEHTDIKDKKDLTVVEYIAIHDRAFIHRKSHSVFDEYEKKLRGA